MHAASTKQGAFLQRHNIRGRRRVHADDVMLKLRDTMGEDLEPVGCSKSVSKNISTPMLF